MSNFTQIGFLRKSFGTEGYIKFSVIDSFDVELSSGDFVFLDLQGSMVPFKIERIEDAKQILKFEWLESLEEANKLAQQPMYLSKKEMPENTAFLVDSDFDGMDLYSAENKIIGRVLEVREFPGQLMMIVMSNEKEVLIPFQEDWVIERNKDGMIYDVPDGILDI